MSNLWVYAASPFTDDEWRGWHDNDQQFHQNIGKALDASGLHYKVNHSDPLPDPEATRWHGACPNDGTCIGSHEVPMEGGYRIIMSHRHGRMEPFIMHGHDDGQMPPHPVDPINDTFMHPLNNASTVRTPTGELGQQMHDYATSPATLQALMDHQRACPFGRR